MDFPSPKFFQPQPLFQSNLEVAAMDANNPFSDTFGDPLCKLNLKETSDFVRSLPITNNIDMNNRGASSERRRRQGVGSMTQRRPSMEAPSTPGRPIFSFSTTSRRNFPSKWDDAGKWVVAGHDSPGHPTKNKHCDGFKAQVDVCSDNSRVTDQKLSPVVSVYHGSAAPLGPHYSSTTTAPSGISVSADVILKDKLTDEVQQILPRYKYSDSSKEGFLFGNSDNEAAKETRIHEVQHRDIGTEMTPIGSSTTSRCHTPLKSSSPARHNTPAQRSGPLPPTACANSTIDIDQLNECHFAKLQLGTNQHDSVASYWSSREEEEAEVSKSLRHFEMDSELTKSVSESKATAWEEEEKTKYCLRYQREEAKIQAWVNLQSAKAEAQSRKLEVKIERMRANLEEKLMTRMANVHQKAEEWRAAARQQHIQQIKKAEDQARKMADRRSSFDVSGRSRSCGCFPPL